MSGEDPSTAPGPVESSSRPRRPGRAGPIRVAILNDYPVIVAGLVATLAPFSDRIEVIALPVGSTTLDADVDIVLVDVFAYASNLGQYISDIAAKVVVYSNVTHSEAVVTVLRAGAAGYIAKGVSAEQLIDALETVDVSSAPVVILQQAASTAAVTGQWPGMTARLTEREAEMLALICQGMTNMEIADRLFLSVNSVKTYVRFAYRKIGVDSRAKAVVWGMQHGMVTPS